MATVAIIPLKALSAAKGRLSPALDADARREFVTWMARRVIAAAAGCPLIDEVVVVAGDEDAAAVAVAAGVSAITVETPGLDAAMAAADAATLDAEITVVVAADLPEVTPEDIIAVLRTAPPGPCVVIAPTRDGGTGALLRRPAGVITTAYGPGSAAAHERAARAAGLDVLRIQRPGLANDVDTPAELPAALALAAGLDVGCPPRQ